MGRYMDREPKTRIALKNIYMKLKPIKKYHFGAQVTKNESIFSSLLGCKHVQSSLDDAGAQEKPLISVHHQKKQSQASSCPVPAVGNVVLGRVSRITASQVNIVINCVEGQVLSQPCGGIVRVEDVFPCEVDHTAVQMANCFRPSDVVKARILSMGDSRQYFLTTAQVRPFKHANPLTYSV